MINFINLFIHKKTKEPYVLYDFQTFRMQRFGGISRYFCEIIRRLHIQYDISVRYTVNYYLTTWNLGNHHIPLFRFIYKHYSKHFEKKNYKLTLKLLQKKGNYIFHPTYYDPYFLKYIGNTPYVITVHDMIYEKFSDMLPNSETVIRQKKEVITHANHIIAISENTKKDIIDLLHIDEKKIDVIYHGTSMKAFSGKPKLKLPDTFILYVGDRMAYKNFNRFIEVFAKLKHEYPNLYIVCTGRSFKKAERPLIDNLNLWDRIIHIKASDKQLNELYGRALCFVYPSLYEGFGIPILEAYACHCPVVLSNTSCFPEIAGNAGCYFDPYSKESMYTAIKSVIDDKQKRKALIEAGSERLKLFSWDKAAQETEAVYRKVLCTNNVKI